jgi:hypothetical protein
VERADGSATLVEPMGSSDRERQERLAGELLRRVDKDGELRPLTEGFAAVLRYRVGRWLIERFGVDSTSLGSLIEETRQLPNQMARHVLLFAPLGWAPSGLEPHDVYVNATELYERTQDPRAAEAILVRGWNAADSLRLFLKRIYGFAHQFEPLRRTFFRRGELIDKALEHHAAGHYEASVPIVLAQIDGIVLDVTGKPFFEHKDTSHLRDDSTIAGVPEGLEVVAAVLSQPVKKTASTGELHRHGVLHGRELGYDTLKNSTKAFVALLAVLEWAQPRADELAAESRRKHEDQFSGSRERDTEGRWLDRRGFENAKDALETVERLQAQFHKQNGRYAERLDLLMPPELWEVWLPKEAPPIALTVANDAREYWVSIQTVSGLHLGIAGVHGQQQSWLYAGEEPPTGGPSTEPAWIDPAVSPPPDWDWEKEP